MAAGHIHRKLAVRVELWTFVVAAPVFLVDPAAALGGILGAIFGVLITPDIDHRVRTFEKAFFYRFGTFVGKAWESFWAPYSIWFDHRGISHWWLLGTFTRVAYLVFAFVKISVTLQFFFDYLGIGLDLIFWIDPLLSLPPIFWLSLFSVWAFQDSVHLIADSKRGREIFHIEEGYTDEDRG